MGFVHNPHWRGSAMADDPEYHHVAQSDVFLMSKESKGSSERVSSNVVAHGQALALARPESAWNEIAGRMKRGEREALAELYDGTSAVVYGMMLRILGDPSAAQEALVEA